jgi:hypothetical protein
VSIAACRRAELFQKAAEKAAQGISVKVSPATILLITHSIKGQALFATSALHCSFVQDTDDEIVHVSAYECRS